MKKFFAIAAALLISVAAFAQETNKDENGKTKFGGYETNKFFDNTFVGVGAGVNFAIDGKITDGLPYLSDKGAVVGYPRLAVDAFVGKWIEPCFGARLGWTGLKTQEPYANENEGFNKIHADLLWNISNQFWGYKENRVYNAVPYASLGFVFNSVGKTPGAGVGLLNLFRLNEKFSIYVDASAMVSNIRILDIAGVGQCDNVRNYSLTAGLTYGFGRTNWTRVSTTAASVAAAIAAANAAKAAAEAKVAGAEKAAADAAKAAKAAQDEADQIKDEANRAAADAANLGGLFDEPVVVYFEIGKSTLTSAEKAHAEYAIKNIVGRGENVKFTLGGSADTKTGTAKRNKQLSEQRAKTVYNLIDELGVSRDNITVVEWDGKTQRFATNELNRAVIIEKQ